MIYNLNDKEQFIRLSREIQSLVYWHTRMHIGDEDESISPTILWDIIETEVTEKGAKSIELIDNRITFKY